MNCMNKFFLATALILFGSGCASQIVSVTPAIVTAKVIDLSGPIITTTDKSIEEGETVTLTELYKVEDVVTKKPETTVTCDNENVTIDKDVASFKSTGEFNFKVVSVDAENNESTATFKVTVNAKPEPTPEATAAPEPTPEEKKETSSSSNSTTQSNTQQSSNNQTTAQAQTDTFSQQSQPATSQPATKYFMFSDGYTMSTALPACKAEFSNYGNGTKKCDPIVGDDGIYKGYVFTYNP